MYISIFILAFGMTKLSFALILVFICISSYQVLANQHSHLPALNSVQNKKKMASYNLKPILSSQTYNAGIALGFVFCTWVVGLNIILM